MLDAVDHEIHLAHAAGGVERGLGTVPGVGHQWADLVDIRLRAVPGFAIGSRNVGEDRVVVAVLTTGDVVRRDALAGEGGSFGAHGGLLRGTKYRTPRYSVSRFPS